MQYHYKGIFRLYLYLDIFQDITNKLAQHNTIATTSSNNYGYKLLIYHYLLVYIHISPSLLHYCWTRMEHDAHRTLGVYLDVTFISCIEQHRRSWLGEELTRYQIPKFVGVRVGEWKMVNLFCNVGFYILIYT